jgi:hypothetical protein
VAGGHGRRRGRYGGHGRQLASASSSVVPAWAHGRRHGRRAASRHRCGAAAGEVTVTGAGVRARVAAAWKTARCGRRGRRRDAGGDECGGKNGQPTNVDLAPSAVLSSFGDAGEEGGGRL